MESLGSTHKKQNYKDDDIISKLPDSIIGHILSFLPTKYAVRTSVLSKRWIEFWTLITKINLDDSELNYSRKRNKNHFINFVNKTLLFTQSCGIERFSLKITKKYDVSLLNAWISCILKQSVKKLHICSIFEFPFFYLTSRTLFNYSCNFEELVLHMCCVAIKVPPCSYLDFGRLKLLKLCGIIFTLDKSLHIGFGTLKKFETRDCSWLSAHNVTIEAPLLESVLIEHHRELVSRESRSCTIKFSASCMKEFTYSSTSGGMPQPIILSNPSSARSASANIILYTRGNRVQETESCACLVLKQFSQVKCIKFRGSEVLTQPNVAVLPKFAMLSHLDLGFVSGEVLLGLLQKTPVLNTLVFQGISKFNHELLKSATVPDCLASSLQIVKFRDLQGSRHELFLAKYFMENGIVLEKMSFYLGYLCESRSKFIEEFKEKLNSFKRTIGSDLQCLFSREFYF